ncbi:metallophosphoesterase [Streptomyces alkaliterrae]|uniref:Metallophosphoesterase n=1 Tax=Streptomyces alkaliterrae TaxID=2213162 RepID=A0A5P0YWX4_9ACTN|nr:metallophosphoesterase [Streptomyces alkaliterrae]MBB1254194.1 metallophosphoesterase [Streptomyces alkaliterrae]MBB1257921.1 metallophosphoesterase [Streptomyces alkaliterrae]MQS04785.1 metallophosphoesterase [Streptomyces alkaliterrae]
MAFALVLVSILCVLSAAHWYLWRRLVRDVSAPGGVWRRTGTALAVLLPLVMVAAQVTGRSDAPLWLKRLLAWPGMLWFALLVYLLLTLLVLEFVRPLLRRWAARRAPAASAEPATAPAAVGRTGATAGPAPADGTAAAGPAATAAASPPDEPADPSRRLFVSRVAAVSAGAVAAVTVGQGTYQVLGAGPVVKHVPVVLDRLPAAADGYRITLISDIHLSPVLGRRACQRIVDRANATRPDLIAIAGDLVDGSVADLRHDAEPLAGLTAREGVFFAIGNHEYYSGAQEWARHIDRELGITVLANRHVSLEHFDLVGVNDPAGEEFGDGPDLARAMADRDERRASVLIAHQPALIHDAMRHGVDLQLSGHTHGGQMWPGNVLAALANPTLFGLERYRDTQLYVTRGAGAWGPPVRVGAEPDITVLELRSR